MAVTSGANIEKVQDKVDKHNLYNSLQNNWLIDIKIQMGLSNYRSKGSSDQAKKNNIVEAAKYLWCL